MARPVYVVHCVDTEGPLHESVEATFERLKAIFGIDLEPSVAAASRRVLNDPSAAVAASHRS